MSQFNYNDYTEVISKAQSGSSTSVKVGYFKLKNDGDEALIRFNGESLNDLIFATVHKPVFGKKFEGLGTGFTPISCLNKVGSFGDDCPFCKAAAEGNADIAKASKVVYVKALVAYKEANGQFGQAVPMVWERPAGFSRELGAIIKDYGPLSSHVFKVTRTGTGKDTRYLISYIPLYDKAEVVSTDFSAFNNFDISKHSFWVRSAEDMATYLATGVFPEVNKDAAPAPAAEIKVAAPVTPAISTPVVPAPAPVVEAPKPVEAPKATNTFGNSNTWNF